MLKILNFLQETNHPMLKNTEFSSGHQSSYDQNKTEFVGKDFLGDQSSNAKTTGLLENEKVTGFSSQGQGNLSGNQGFGSQGQGNLSGNQGFGSQGQGNLSGNQGFGSQGQGNLSGNQGFGSQGQGNLSGNQGFGSQGQGTNLSGNQGFDSQGFGSQGQGTNLSGNQGIGAQGTSLNQVNQGFEGYDNTDVKDNPVHEGTL